jgi:hypothetical protein
MDESEVFADINNVLQGASVFFVYWTAAATIAFTT